MINYLIASLYILISLFFMNNFKKIYLKLKDGKNINKNSLLATSSLIFQFIALAVHFATENSQIVLVSQMYLLFCVLLLIIKKD